MDYFSPVAVVRTIAQLKCDRQSAIHQHLDGSGTDRAFEHVVILLRLISVGEREPTHGLVEIVLLAKIAADRPRAPAFGCARTEETLSQSGALRFPCQFKHKLAMRTMAPTMAKSAIGTLKYSAYRRNLPRSAAGELYRRAD